MELETICLLTIAEGLRLEILSLSEQGRPVRQVEAFPVPLIDVAGELALAKAMPVLCWADRIIADLHLPVRMRTHAMAKMACEHLRAETNPNKGNPLFEGDADPVYFAAQPSVFVIHAHGAAEDDHAGIAFERLRQRIAETGTAAVKLISLRA
jgi:hypothetical protein